MSDAALLVVIAVGKILNIFFFINFFSSFVVSLFEQSSGSYRVLTLCSSHHCKDCYCGYGMEKSGWKR